MKDKDIGDIMNLVAAVGVMPDSEMPCSLD